MQEVSSSLGGEPVKLEYEVVKITPQEVRAVVRGTIPEWTMPVQGELPRRLSQ